MIFPWCLGTKKQLKSELIRLDSCPVLITIIPVRSQLGRYSLSVFHLPACLPACQRGHPNRMEVAVYVWKKSVKTLTKPTPKNVVVGQEMPATVLPTDILLQLSSGKRSSMLGDCDCPMFQTNAWDLHRFLSQQRTITARATRSARWLPCPKPHTIWREVTLRCGTGSLLL
jgi:hypothetical protein